MQDSKKLIIVIKIINYVISVLIIFTSCINDKLMVVEINNMSLQKANLFPCENSSCRGDKKEIR